MALGDIWELRLAVNVLTENTFNVFHYEETTEETGINPEVSIAEAFYEDVVPSLAGLLDTTAYARYVDVRQLTGGTAIHTKTSTVAGVNTSEVLPRFVAYSFRLNRSSSAGRHGYKRFAGVPEAAMTDALQVSAFDAAVAAMESALFNTISTVSGGANGVFTPRILSRYSGGQERVTPIVQPIASVTFTGFTTQNTRK